MNHSFIISRNSIIGRNISDLMNTSSKSGLGNVSYELRGRSRVRSISGVSDDDSFFRTDDPDSDPIQAVDILL
jgi:hypothetical protein